MLFVELFKETPRLMMHRADEHKLGFEEYFYGVMPWLQLKTPSQCVVCMCKAWEIDSTNWCKIVK